MSRSCPQSDKSEGHAGCQTCRANSIPTAFPSAGEPTTRIECRGGHRRFLANDRGTVSATARPALSGFGLQWAWRRFYQIALSPGPLQAAASRVLAWSQLARKKAGCLVRARAVLPNHLMNTPRKLFTGIEPARPRPRQTGSSQTGHLAALRLFPFKEVQATTLSLTSRGDGK